MNYGEKITSGTDDDVPDWVAMMRHTREGGESPVDEAPDRLAAADEAFARQCENLSETNREELARLSEDITKIGRGNILSDKAFCSDDDIAALKRTLLPPNPSDEDAQRRLSYYENDTQLRDDLREIHIKEALDYFVVRGDAEARLSNIVAEHGDSFDETDASGIEEMIRILRPRAGDDIHRLQYTASMLADGYPVNPQVDFVRDFIRGQRESNMLKGEKILQARIRDLGNYHILRNKIAEAMERPDVAEMSAVDALAADGDSIVQYLRVVNPLRLDYERAGGPDWNEVPPDLADLSDADPTNLCRVLSAYDRCGVTSNVVLARNYSPNELMALSDQETENFENFLRDVSERMQEAPEVLRERLAQLANAIVVCDSTTGDKRSKGGILRNGNGLAARQYFDCAFEAATNPYDSEDMRVKKVRVMTQMLLSSAAIAGQEEGFKNNLFPAMSAGDKLALSLAEDEFLPDGSPNPDADKNWTRGFGLGLADYIASCYVRPATPKNIHELIMQHDSLPGLNQENYFQNREDARVLSTEERGYQDVNIFYSRDFIHNQMPHAHEALVYQWAYQKIGRKESFSDEERAMLRQIGHVPPAENMSDEERATFLSSFGDEYFAFLNDYGLADVVIGMPAITDVQLKENEDMFNMSDETFQQARRHTLERVSLDLSKYDEFVMLLDTSSNREKAERVSDVLWRLVKNTDRLTIQAPETGDAELDSMLAKIDLSINEQGNCPVELRDLRDVMPAINSRLRNMQGKREMNPQFIDALSFISRASNYALKDLPKKELRELFYDPTFKEIVRFHSLTWQRGEYSEAGFENTWRKFSNIKMEDSDSQRLEHYAILNRMILNQSESLVQMYQDRSQDEHELEQQYRELGAHPRYDRISSNSGSCYARTALLIESTGNNHGRQAAMYRNFANSVWSLNLSSTLAKIGYGLAE